jgi:DNA-binding transcriptional regulator YhcF (GntR family)
MFWAVRDLRGLPGPAKAVLYGLVACREADGTIRPSLSQLERATGLHRVTVVRALANLRDAGCLTSDPGSKGKCNRYHLTLPLNGEVVAESNQLQRATSSGEQLGQLQRATRVVAESNQGGCGEQPSEDLSEDRARATLPGIDLDKPKSQKRPKTKASKSVPSDWTPSPETISTLRSKGYSDEQIQRELERMRRHDFAKAKSDWDKTALNWITRDPPKAARPVGPGMAGKRLVQPVPVDAPWLRTGGDE